METNDSCTPPTDQRVSPLETGKKLRKGVSNRRFYPVSVQEPSQLNVTRRPYCYGT